MMRINQLTGEPAQPGDKKVITEVFKTGSQPGSAGARASQRGIKPKSSPESGTGGLY